MNKKTLSEILNSAPDPSLLKSRSAGGKSLSYIPVGIMENMLDELFGVGGWQTQNFIYHVKEDTREVVGQLQLLVLINGVWVSRIGAGASPIRYYSENHNYSPGQRIPNTLEMDVPHCLSDCFTNACKKLGKWFGRDLNRDHVSNFDTEKTEVLSSDSNKPWFRSTSPRFASAIESLKIGGTTVDAILGTFQVTLADLEKLKKAEGEHEKV